MILDEDESVDGAGGVGEVESVGEEVLVKLGILLSLKCW